MKLISWACYAFTIASSTLGINGVSAQTGDSLTELIPLFPTCALACIVTQFTPEILSHPAASCQNATLQLSISTCVQGSCNYTEQAQLGTINNRLCEGVPLDMSRANALVIVAAIVGPLGILAILLRTYSRCVIIKQMGSDDWTMLAAGVFLIGVLACNFENIHGYGFGKHYWNLDPTKVTPLLKIFFAAEIFYIMVITLVKVSILQFYLRVFPTPWFKIANLVTIALVIAAGLGVLFPIIFQCSPVRGAWDKSIASKCLNINLLAYATGGIAVGFDIIILILPVPELWKLNMGLRKKLSVLFMFSLGSIACVTSMVRLKYLGEFARTTDATYDNTIPVLWSILEICIAIICACLPALRALFAHYLPRLFPNYSTHAASNKYRHQDAYNTSGVKGSAANTTTISSTSDQGRKRDLLSPTSTILEKGGRSPLSRDGSWLGSRSAITRNQEVVQDVERDAFPLQSPLEDGFNRNATVTTKIWVAHTPTDASFKSPHDTSPERDVSEPSARHHGIHPLRSNSVDASAQTNMSEEFLNQSHRSPMQQNTIRRSPMSSTHYDTISREISRNGSEDSIFALEGPRHSDDEEERVGEKSRGRRDVDEEYEMDQLEQNSRISARRRDESGSRNGRAASRGRIPVSVFNRNPPE